MGSLDWAAIKAAGVDPARHSVRERPLPTPTDIPAASPEKVKLLAARHRLGQLLWHPADPVWVGARELLETGNPLAFLIAAGQPENNGRVVNDARQLREEVITRASRTEITAKVSDLPKAMMQLWAARGRIIGAGADPCPRCGWTYHRRGEACRFCRWCELPIPDDEAAFVALRIQLANEEQEDE